MGTCSILSGSNAMLENRTVSRVNFYPDVVSPGSEIGPNGARRTGSREVDWLNPGDFISVAKVLCHLHRLTF